MTAILIAGIFALFSISTSALAVVTPFGPPQTRSPAAESAPIVQGEVLLKVRPGVSATAVAATVEAAVARPVGDGSIVLLRLQRGDVATAVRALQGQEGVVFAEPNRLRRLHVAPDDAGYPLKWDLNNNGSLSVGSDRATADADIDWQEAYDLLGASFSGSAVVAVIDTGIDAAHPDLTGKLTSARYDFLDNDSNPADSYGHGTHVAGIALAETGNGIGTAGVAFSSGIQVMPLRVCDHNGCPTSAIVDAMYFATANGADVINLSLGGRFGSSAELQAIDYAWSQGLVVVASSGNDSAGKVSYPAAFTNAIAVGSTNFHDQVASYSNKGGDLDLTAPGGEMYAYHDPRGIYSTMPTYPVFLTSSYGYEQGYDQLQGTSMAAPQVSGLAALLFSLDTIGDDNGNGRINDEIRAILEATADDLGSSGWDRNFGWGRINAFQAVLAATGASGGTGEQPPPAPPATGGALSASVSTDQPEYVSRDKVLISAAVSDGSNAVAAASVHIVITAPLKTLSCDTTTNGSGQASCTYKVNSNRDGVGMFNIDVTASKDGYDDGTASTSFVVK
jgi:subtilisin family serine protease